MRSRVVHVRTLMKTLTSTKGLFDSLKVLADINKGNDCNLSCVLTLKTNDDQLTRVFPTSVLELRHTVPPTFETNSIKAKKPSF